MRILNAAHLKQGVSLPQYDTLPSMSSNNCSLLNSVVKGCNLMMMTAPFHSQTFGGLLSPSRWFQPPRYYVDANPYHEKDWHTSPQTWRRHADKTISNKK